MTTLNELRVDHATDTTVADAERQYVGTLMHHPAFPGVVLCSGVVEGDFADPKLRVVFAAIRRLFERKEPATPVQVLQEVLAEHPGGEDSRRALTALLADLYVGAILPESTGYYRKAVLDHALRRRIRAAGERLIQAAEGDTLASCVRLVGAEVTEVYGFVGRRAKVVGDEVRS